MAAESLVEAKLDASKTLSQELIGQGSSLLASYWDFIGDVDRWTLTLVPTSPTEGRRLVHDAVALLVAEPYQSVLSVDDPLIDGKQIDRARALGSYIRMEPYVGRRIDQIITGGQYFESVIPVYFAPELMTRLRAA